MSQLHTCAFLTLAIALPAGAQDAARPIPPLVAARVHLGEGDGAAFGAGLAILVDVNRDGLTDYAIGAPRDASQAGSEGSVSVFSGRDGRLLYLQRSGESGTSFGHAVAGGDVDGDGFGDLIVGAPYAGKDGRAHVGCVHVFSGKDGRLLRTLWGRDEGEAFGWAVAALGDRDGDKSADFAVSAPHADRMRNRKLLRDVGRVEVHSGKRLKLLFTSFGDVAEDRFGWCMTAAGDTDGDRDADLLVGAEGAIRGDERPGSLALVSGRGGAILSRLFGSPDDYFGVAACSVGDLDGDGRQEFAVGAWNARVDETRPGEVSIFAGGSTKLLQKVQGRREFDHFGQAVAGVGDLDGDGTPDFAVGAPAKSTPGYVQIFSGKTFAVLCEVRGERERDRFGATLAAGDLDGDGVAELLVGATQAGGDGVGPGRVIVYSTTKQRNR